jgi:hypothetical protein
MPIAKMKLSDPEVKINDHGLTLFTHRDDIELVNDRDDVMTISPQDTMAMADKFTERTWTMCKADEDFKSRLRIIYPDLDIVADGCKTLAEYPPGIRHVVGLIVCTNKAINTGKIPYWQFPEASLHPATQSKLADLATRYIKDAEENARLYQSSIEEAKAKAERAEALANNPDPQAGSY